MDKIMKIERHRMGTDGVGVSTLVAFHGCPLHCKYCINDFCHDADIKTIELTVSQLLDTVKIDDMFFRMTRGGVVFGGGEPLLHSEYIEKFLKVAPREWQYRVETSLYANWEAIKRLLPYVDEWIVDVKDFNDSIYQKYTGKSNQIVKANLTKMSEQIAKERIRIRVPLIKGYNNLEDCEITEKEYSAFGTIDRFTYRIREQGVR